jgi:hypothetical protein
MHWRRDYVDWKNAPSLLGKQKDAEQQVDFNEQIGIYILYNNSQIIYVGRAMGIKKDRPIAQRLFEHTVDRLEGRWDRFSWFSIYPVDDKGKLDSDFLIREVTNENLTIVLEALLIEAMEPSQNRRRGDDFSIYEYLQVRDPTIDKKNKRLLLKELLIAVEK